MIISANVMYHKIPIEPQSIFRNQSNEHDVSLNLFTFDLSNLYTILILFIENFRQNKICADNSLVRPLSPVLTDIMDVWGVLLQYLWRYASVR